MAKKYDLKEERYTAKSLICNTAFPKVGLSGLMATIIIRLWRQTYGSTSSARFTTA